MPEVARRYEDRYYYYEDTVQTCTAIPVKKYTYTATPVRKRKVQVKKNSAKVKRNNLIARVVTLSVLSVLGVFVLPVGFKNIAWSIFTKSPYPNLKADYRKMIFPTVNYLNNNFLRKNFFLLH